jgi:hypothetical protein
MTDRDEAARAEVLVRLAVSREELRCLLASRQKEPNADGSSIAGAEFPRSRTMQMLMSGRGLGAVGAVVAGLFIARPALALRLLRMLPAGAVARMLLMRAITLLRARRE